MSVIDVAALAAPMSAEKPAGEYLEYTDPAWGQLQKDATATAPVVMAGETKPGKEPVWSDVKSSALALFKKTRDLQVAMILATALLKVDGAAGLLDGVKVVHGMVAGLWDHLYPPLDVEDNNDPTRRVNLLKGFDGNGSAADIYKFKLRLREMPLTNSKAMGRFCFRDVQIAKGEIVLPAGAEGAAAKFTPLETITAAFDTTAPEDLKKLEASLGELREEFDALDKTLGEKLPGGMGVNFTDLKSLIKQIMQVVKGARKDGGAEAVGVGDAGVSAGPSSGESGGPSVPGRINSRADVIAVLDKVCDYYARVEPNSPVPMFMNRAKRLVGMKFEEVIKDLAPDAVSRIEIFSGTTPAPPPPA